ncbi:MAG: PEP-CTERM sorting domain-containing protein [Anaerohalosphaeraceae bacterium]
MSVTDPQENSSVFVVNPDGTASVFCSMTWILDLEFDTTSAGAFGGFLYGCRSSWAIGRISPEGRWTRFAFSGSADEAIKCLTFGPDNSMYVIEELAANQIVVLKVSAVPEPTTFFLTVLGGLVLRKRAAGFFGDERIIE